MDQDFTVTDKRARNWAEVKQDAVDQGLITQERIDAVRDDVRENLLRAQAEADDSGSSARRQVLTAFVVILDYDGGTQATSDLSVIHGVEASREANYADMYAACGHIQKDITNQEVAMRTVAALQQHAMQAQQALQAAQIRQQMGHPLMAPRR